jgi:hypothetical protein
VYGVIGASNEGTVQADFSLDDGFTTMFNPPSPATIVAFGQLMFSANNLPPTQHKITGTSKANASFVVDYILVESGPESTESAKPASSTDTASSEPPSRGGITPGAIAGIVIGCLVGVIIIVMVYWLVRRRNRADSSIGGPSGTSTGFPRL